MQLKNSFLKYKINVRIIKSTLNEYCLFIYVTFMLYLCKIISISKNITSCHKLILKSNKTNCFTYAPGLMYKTRDIILPRYEF